MDNLLKALLTAGTAMRGQPLSEDELQNLEEVDSMEDVTKEVMAKLASARGEQVMAPQTEISNTPENSPTLRDTMLQFVMNTVKQDNLLESGKLTQAELDKYLDSRMDETSPELERIHQILAKPSMDRLRAAGEIPEEDENT